jgi:hypothetical protein
VRWPIDADAVRMRLSDKLAARLPALGERLAPRLLAEPAGSRRRRWVLTRGLTAGFAATDRGDWDYLKRIYEPDVSLRIGPDVAPDAPELAESFSALRSALEQFYEITANADSRPVEIIDLGGPHFVGRIQFTSKGAYSGLAMNRQMFNLYELSARGRASRQWLCLDLETAEEFYAERLPVSPGR